VKKKSDGKSIVNSDTKTNDLEDLGETMRSLSVGNDNTLDIYDDDSSEEQLTDFKIGPSDVFCKVADFGNACWVFHHFSDDITTRQYRSPEAIVGGDYGTGVDMWSLACMIFELLTGDYLFDPKADNKNQYSRDEDHLALMCELMGPMPRVISQRGSKSNLYFNRKGEFLRIRSLEMWPLYNVLTEKYLIDTEEAELIASFLLPMLSLSPNERISASDALLHPWLNNIQSGVVEDSTASQLPATKPAPRRAMSI